MNETESWNKTHFFLSLYLFPPNIWKTFFYPIMFLNKSKLIIQFPEKSKPWIYLYNISETESLVYSKKYNGTKL